MIGVDVWTALWFTKHRVRINEQSKSYSRERRERYVVRLLTEVNMSSLLRLSLFDVCVMVSRLGSVQVLTTFI